MRAARRTCACGSCKVPDLPAQAGHIRAPWSTIQHSSGLCTARRRRIRRARRPPPTQPPPRPRTLSTCWWAASRCDLCVTACARVCGCVSLCVYEAVPHVGAQLDHVAEVGSASRMLRAVSYVLQLGTKPTQLLRVVDIAQSLLNDVDNCESVPRCVNMFRSASHFHSGFCRVLDLPLQPRPPIPTCHGAAGGPSNSSRRATFCAPTLMSSGRASRTHTPTRRTT